MYCPCSRAHDALLLIRDFFGCIWLPNLLFVPFVSLFNYLPLHRRYRASRLTQLLRGCFTQPGHRSVIIATVSPTSTDLQHSVNSIGHVVLTNPTLEALCKVCMVCHCQLLLLLLLLLLASLLLLCGFGCRVLI